MCFWQWSEWLLFILSGKIYPLFKLFTTYLKEKSNHCLWNPEMYIEKQGVRNDQGAGQQINSSIPCYGVCSDSITEGATWINTQYAVSFANYNRAVADAVLPS